MNLQRFKTNLADTVLTTADTSNPLSLEMDNIIDLISLDKGKSITLETPNNSNNNNNNNNNNANSSSSSSKKKPSIKSILESISNQSNMWEEEYNDEYDVNKFNEKFNKC